MEQPKNELPWSITLYGAGDPDKNYEIRNANGSIISQDDAYEQYGLCTKDAEYATIAANQYPILLEFLKDIKETTEDDFVAWRISVFLKEKGYD